MKLLQSILTSLAHNEDNIISFAGGVMLNGLLFFNKLMQVGFDSFAALTVGIFGGLGGLLIKDFYKWVKGKING